LSTLFSACCPISLLAVERYCIFLPLSFLLFLVVGLLSFMTLSGVGSPRCDEVSPLREVLTQSRNTCEHIPTYASKTRRSPYAFHTLGSAVTPHHRTGEPALSSLACSARPSLHIPWLVGRLLRNRRTARFLHASRCVYICTTTQAYRYLRSAGWRLMSCNRNRTSKPLARSGERKCGVEAADVSLISKQWLPSLSACMDNEYVRRIGQIAVDEAVERSHCYHILEMESTCTSVCTVDPATAL
jgi:hypothetical protein